MSLNPVGSSHNVGQMPAQTNPSKSMQSPVTEIANKALKGNESRAKSTLGHRFVTWLKSVGSAIRRLFSCCVAKEKGGRLPNPSNSTPNSRAYSSDSLPPLVPVADPSIPVPPPPPGSNPPPPSGNPPPPPPPPPTNGTPGGRIPTSLPPSPAANGSVPDQQNSAPIAAAKKGHQKNDSAALLNSSQDLQKKIEERRKKLEEQETNQPQESSPAAAQTPPPRSNSAPVTPAGAPKKQAIATLSSQKKPAPAKKPNPIAFDPKQAVGVVLRKSPRATPVNTQTSQENVDPGWAAKQAALKAKAENQDQDQ